VRKFKIKSFCKINLSLRVERKINNRLHNIKSLITFCGLYDIISVSSSRDFKDNISFSGRFKSGINKESNTITKVLTLLRGEGFLKKKTFKINVKKNIPHGSGLGGGSSNAAALLKFLNKKIRLKLNKNKLNKIANQIGSDVPICLEKKNILFVGKMHKSLKINKKFKLNILIVFPNIICATKQIYQKNKKFTDLKLSSNFYFDDKRKLINRLIKEKNDLQKIVTTLHPKVQKIISLIQKQNGCYFSRITGSGSACIGIFSNMKSAIFTQKLIKLKFPKYWCIVSKTI